MIERAATTGDPSERHGRLQLAAIVAAQMASVYTKSQVLAVAVQLGIADLVGDGTMTSDEIARETETQPDPMRRLLRALAAFGVVNDLGSGQFKLTPVGQSLRVDSPDSVRASALLFVSDSHWQTFGRLGDCVKTGRNGYDLAYGVENCFAFYDRHPEMARIFNDAMSNGSARLGQGIAKAYDFSSAERIVDVGGGQGRAIAAILKTHTSLRGTLFDLPRVVEGASRHLAEEGVAERCDVVGGDMFASVPAGGDVYLICHVIHDWDDANAIRVLRSCCRAMAPRASLIIADAVVPERMVPDRAAQLHAISDLRMMVAAGGRERTGQEFESILRAAGLRFLRVIPMDSAASLVEAAPA